MSGWPGKPVIYEVNTAIWLGDLSRAAGRRVSLADVPAPAWDEVTPDGIDAVWLMGVWERSPAMLMTNGVFAKTWGGRTGAEPAGEFWPAVIAGLRSRYPQTVLIAEAYWDMEWTLQQQGFDFCYDKRLYDRLVGRDTSGVRDHLRAGLDYQSRLVRFGENHDEPRIADTLPGDAGRAAAVAIATLPGATLWYEGQFEGRRVRPPVFLSRRPDEPPDAALAGWYRRLLAAVASHGCGRAPGSCSTSAAGPTTIPAATSSPGPGPVPAPGRTWWWPTSPLSPPRDESGSNGSICAAGAGLLPT